MKLLAPVFRAFVAGFALLSMAGLSPGQTSAEHRIIPAPASNGLQLSLSTNSFEVSPDAAEPVTAKGRTKKKVVRRVLLASVLLANRSGTDIEFAFPDAAAAERRFDLRVLDASGEQVWSSATVSEEDGVSLVLSKKSKWSRTVRIPLEVEGVTLPIGRYTLEAAIAGEPRIGATTLFEIVAPPVPPQPKIPKNTGIRGLVLTHASIFVKLDGTALALAVMPHPTVAKIRIQEIFPENVRMTRPPFVWEGQSDIQGRFQADTPVGQFLVQATVENRETLTSVQNAEPQNVTVDSTVMVIPPVPPRTSVTTNANVKAGAYTEVSLGLGGGCTFEQPRADTGIKGQVFRTGAAGEDPVPQAGAIITVEEIRLNPNPNHVVIMFPLQPPLRWTGITDANGRFQVNTPAKRFRITAKWGQNNFIETTTVHETQSTTDIIETPFLIPLQGSAEATVIDRQFTNAEIHLQPALVEIGRELVWSVGEVSVRVLPTFAPPAMIQVSAQGMVNTGGWSMPHLRYRQTTAEGIVEFDFVAKAPTGIVTQAFAPISATAQVEQPANFRGVRVYSKVNSALARPELR